MCMMAGTRTMRINVASRNTASASPNPMNCTASTRAKAKLPKTMIMMNAANVIVAAGLVEHFLHARQQEDLVVHRQAENRGKDEHRHDDEDRLGRSLEPEQARAIAVLEDQYRHPE